MVFDYSPCFGGHSWMSISYLTRFSGPYLESQDPYAAYSEPCPVLGNTQTAFEFDARLLPKEINDIKQAMMDNGAIYTVFIMTLHPLMVPTTPIITMAPMYKTMVLRLLDGMTRRSLQAASEPGSSRTVMEQALVKTVFSMSPTMTHR